MKNLPARSFKLALAQMAVFAGQRDRNVAHAVAMIASAAKAGAAVVLLPEALDLGWTYPASRERAEPIPEGGVCRAYRAAAREHGVYVCAGLTERSGAAVFNAAVLISPQGEVLLHHRKLNELEIAHDVYDQGDRLTVVRTPLATFGLMICADAFAGRQIVGRVLGLMGAEVILSPSAWAVPPGYDHLQKPYGDDWQEIYAAVARDYGLWVAGCSNVGVIDGGPWHGHACIGRSLVVGPAGTAALVGPYGHAAEKLLLVDVALEARTTRTGRIAAD